MAEIAVRAVSKEYDTGTLAVDAVDLDVADGELLVLVGPSGCGKSTLLRMIAGLEEVTSGSIHIAGRDVTNLAPRQRDIAMVFQGYALYPHLSVRRNIGYPLKLAKVPAAEREARVEDAARLLQLTEVLDRRPAQLSGGQRQRVAMGRAIVRAPQAFLMDEPLSNLDAKLRVEMRAEIARLQRALATTTIYVTHDQVEAMTMGTRVAVLDAGRLQQVGAPQRVYDAPRNLFVASFIGSPAMNLFAAQVRAAASGHLEVTFGGQRLALPDELAGSASLRGALDRPLVLGVRPEAFTDVTLEPGVPPERVIEVTVDLVESLGAEQLVHAAIAPAPAADGQPSGSPRGIVRVPARSRARAGEALKLAVDTTALHLFDPQTGRAIAGAGASA